MDARARDPYYVVREEIAAHVRELREKVTAVGPSSSSQTTTTELSRWSALRMDVESAKWELDELNRAVSIAEKEPARFSLRPEELESRKTWGHAMGEEVAELRAFVEGKLGDLMTTTGPPTVGATSSIDLESQQQSRTTTTRSGSPMYNHSAAGFDDHQQLLVRKQDEDLDDISASISRIGRVGLTIGEELATQSKMLEDLEEDVDGVNARLQAAERKMREVLKKAGLRGQLCVIFFLSVVLFILFYIALNSA